VSMRLYHPLRTSASLRLVCPTPIKKNRKGAEDAENCLDAV
jgi:hypothetical protein